MFSAVTRQSGVIRAGDEDELADVTGALLSLPLPRGNRVGILTIGGGFGVMAAEACEREGLSIAPYNQALLPNWTKSCLHDGRTATRLTW